MERAARLSTPFYESAELRRAVRKVADIDVDSPAIAELRAGYGLSDDEAIVLCRHLLEVWVGFEADYRSGDRTEVRRQVELFVKFPDNRIFTRSFPFSPDFNAVVREALTT